MVAEELSKDCSNQLLQLEMKSLTQSEHLEVINISDFPSCHKFSEFQCMKEYSGSSCTSCDTLHGENKQLRNQVKSLQSKLKQK